MMNGLVARPVRKEIYCDEVILSVSENMVW